MSCKRLLIAFLALGTYLAGADTAFSQTSAAPSTYALSGMVRLPDGAPAPRAVVRISSPTGFDRQAIADNEGRFEIRDLPRGRFRMTALNPNDADQVSEFSEIDTSRTFSAAVVVNLYLKYRPDKTREVAKAPVVSAREVTRHVPRQASKLFEEAQKFGTEGKLHKAEAGFTKALEVYPDYEQALVERGNVRVAGGRIPEAAADFAKALNLDPNYGPALRGTGVCKFQSGNPAGAVTDLERAAAVEPDSPRNFMFLGLAYMAIDQRSQARSAFQRALSLDPRGSARAHVHLANMYIKDNQPIQAISQIEAYLAAVPTTPDREKLVSLASQLKASLR